MNSQNKSKVIDQTGLIAERTTLKACIRSYDRLIRALGDCMEAASELPGDFDRSAVVTQIETLKSHLDRAAAAYSERTKNTWRDSVRRLRRLGVRCCGVVLVLAAIAFAVQWWLYSRPAQFALQQLDGSWRQFDVTDAGEAARNNYREYDGDVYTWSYYVPYNQTWTDYKRKVELAPAKNFFSVKTTTLPGARPAHQSECYVQIFDNKIIEIRGIHPLDPMPESRVYVWRPTNRIPTDEVPDEFKR